LLANRRFQCGTFKTPHKARISLTLCLQETKVGMSVNKLRANTDKNVAELAKEIVTKWKNDVHLAKNKASARAAADKPRSAASPTTSQRPITPDTRAGSKPVQSNAKAASDPMQRNKSADNVNCSVTGDKARDSMVGILYDALCIGSNACMYRISQILGRF
jgi:transcription elongation factor S-II